MALIEVEKKFIFTDEGRNLLISQEGGVRFAAIGGILVQGLIPVPANEFWDTYRGLTFEQLLDNDNIVIGMPDVAYRTVNNGLIEPVSEEQYQAALEDIKSGNGKKHMFGTYYQPNRELQSQSGSHYGTYEFTYDKTSLAWDMESDVSFSMLVLLGKQYAEHDDALFNVAQTQRPVIIGVAQLPGVYNDEIGPLSFAGGIEFLADQDKYICTSLRLQFTLTDADHDATEELTIDQEYLDMLGSMSIINDGLKTRDEIHIVDANQPDDTLAKLDSALNRNTDTDLRVAPSPGSIATQRTMMIADPYYATELENQWNAAAQVHIVNKKIDKDNETMYKEQIVLTTLESPENLTAEELTAYYAGFMLRGTGNFVEGDTNKGAGPEYIPASAVSGGISAVNIHYNGYESPIFRQVAVPEYDKYAVDIFGIENKVLDSNNIDKFIFSQRNVSFQPADPEEYGYEDDAVNYGYNVALNSHENIMNANTNNTLVRANGNILSGYSNCNLLFGSDRNLFVNGANTNIVFGSDLNIFDGEDSQGNIIFGGSENIIDGTVRSLYFNGTGLMSFGRDEKVLMGQYNADTDAKWVIGCGTDNDNRRNALEFFPETGMIKLFNNGTNIVTLGGSVGFSLGNNLPISTKKLVTEELKVFNDINNQNVTNQSYGRFEVQRTSNGALIPQLWMKTLSGPDTPQGYDFNHLLNYYGGNLNLAYNYHKGSQGGPIATSTEANFFGGCADFMVDNGYGYVLINQEKDEATNTPSKNPGYIPSVEVYDRYNSIQIEPNVIRFTSKNPAVSKALSWSDIGKWNKLIETQYSKLSIDLITDYNEDTTPLIGGWRCGITNIRGPKFYRKWIRNVFDAAPPLFMNGHKYDSEVYSNIFNSTGTLGKELLYLGKDHQPNITTFNTRAAQYGGRLYWKKDNRISVDDDAEPIYMLEIPYDPDYLGDFDNSGMLDEIEINLQLTDLDDTDWVFPLIFWMKPNGSDIREEKVPKITLNVSLYDCGSGNGRGENFYIWKYNHFKNKLTTGSNPYKEYLYNHEFGSNEYKKVHRFTSYPIVASSEPTGAAYLTNNYKPCGWLADDFDDVDG